LTGYLLRRVAVMTNISDSYNLAPLSGASHIAVRDH
jgi:hypothetical protein